MHLVSYFVGVCLILIFKPAVTMDQNDDHETLSEEIERDLRSRDLSEQFAAFKTKYSEKLTGLGAKLDLYLEERNRNNNAMEVVAELMKVVMTLQEQIKKIEQSLHRKIVQVRTDMQQNNFNIKANVSSEMLLQKNQLHNEIQETADTYMNVNSSLSQKIQVIETTFNENNNIYRNSTDILTDRIEALDEKIKNKYNAVGFTYRLHNINSYYDASSTISFSSKISDIGGGYNVSDGIFYCQHSGIYMFATSITTTTNELWIFFVKNGQRIGYAYETKSTDWDSYSMSTTWDSFSGTTVVSLTYGDRIRLESNKRARLHSRSVFTGVRISD